MFVKNAGRGPKTKKLNPTKKKQIQNMLMSFVRRCSSVTPNAVLASVEF